MQHMQALVIHGGEIHLVFPAAPADAIELLLLQPSVLNELIEVDEVRIAREGGEGLIRRISVAGRVDRQDLPVGLPGFFEKINKVKALFPMLPMP